MSQLRISKIFWIKAYDIPINTSKNVCYNWCKNKFKSLLITEENINRRIHNIAIQNESRVVIQYILEILKTVYKDLQIENIKFSKFKDVIQKLTRADPTALYSGFNISELG